jgi:UDP-GlcNAc:undecaprenyl-phosphate GlcNAc-1-phosphate transferase
VRAYLLMIAITAAVTFIATHFVIKLTRKYKIYPEIRSRDSHSIPTPRLGGIGMFAGFLVAMGTAASLGWFKSVFVQGGPILGVLIAASIIAILGALDDVFDLDWMLKLGGQFVAAGILAWNGVQIVSLPIGGITIGSFGMSFVVSVFLTVLIMNAVNFIDGLDGLVAGVVLIGTSTFFIYSYLLAQKTTPSNYFSLASLISAIVIGMCLGFLPHNWRPAKIFMGDSGALLLALLMTTSAVSVTGQLDPAFIAQSNLMPAFLPMILPLAILVLPLLDFTLAVLRRLRAGKSPFAADRQHLHHRLQDFGHGHLGSVIVFYVWTLLISATCLLLFLAPVEWAIAFGSVGTIFSLTYTIWPVLVRKLAERRRRI